MSRSKEALDKGANIQGLIKMDVREKIGRYQICDRRQTGQRI